MKPDAGRSFIFVTAQRRYQAAQRLSNAVAKHRGVTLLRSDVQHPLFAVSWQTTCAMLGRADSTLPATATLIQFVEFAKACTIDKIKSPQATAGQRSSAPSRARQQFDPAPVPEDVITRTATSASTPSPSSSKPTA